MTSPHMSPCNGWCTTQPSVGATCASVSGTSYSLAQSGVAISSVVTTPGSSATLYAVWTANATDTINYSANTGTGSASATTGLAGTTVTLSGGGSIALSGHTLAGWCTTQPSVGATCASVSGTSYSLAQSGVAISSVVTTPGSSATLYAVWTPVVKVTPVITWANPSPILFGTPLGATQLDAVAKVGGNPVAGTYTYSPPAGTVLQPGTDQTLSVTFTPTNTAAYISVPAKVSINVVFSAACIATLKTGPFIVATGQSICVTAGGRFSGAVTVSTGGALWVNGGSITGPLVVKAGGVLSVSGGTIGSLQAAGASALTLCATDVFGPITITGSTGQVLIGGAGCSGNIIIGAVSITGNTGGVGFSRNAVIGSVKITGNTGGFQYSTNLVLGAVNTTGNS
jgi:hypothetical protein